MRKFKQNLIENKDYIISEYLTGKNSVKLSKQFGCTTKTICNLLERYGVERRCQSEAQRKYEINENFFDEINSSEKAYFLGLLYADGTNNTQSNNIAITLIEEDKDILEKFATTIFTNEKPLYFRKGVLLNNKKRNKSYQCNNTYTLSIHNKHISQILSKHGMVRNKSLILEFPNFIKENIIKDFVRGYFDGDGCLYFYEKRKEIQIDICATNIFCKYLQDILYNLDIKSSICKCNGGAIDRIRICGNISSKKFLDWIYKDATLYMERKYKKYLFVINNIKHITKYNSCTICNEKHYCKGYCNKHYRQIIKFGSIIN